MESIEDLTKPDVRTIVGVKQGGPNHQIRHTTPPVRPGLSDAMRLLVRIKNKAGWKFGG